MAMTPATIVPAPEPLAKRYGLFLAAAGPLPFPDGRLGGDITYEPVACGTAHTLENDCVDQDTPVEKTFDDGDDWVEAQTFIVYATLVCGSVGAGDLETRLRRRLDNGAQSAVEERLSAILEANAVSVPAPVDTAASSVIGELEQWMYGTQGYGNVAYIHAPFRMASYLHKGTLLWTDSVGRVRTRLGSVVVFGNYTDDGSVFISGQTAVWRDPEVSMPPREQVLNRTNNNFYMLGEQTYAVAYECAAGVAQYTLEGTT